MISSKKLVAFARTSKVKNLDARTLSRMGVAQMEGLDPRKLEAARRAIAEGQRDPIRLVVGKRGQLGISDGRHRFAAAVEAGVPIKARLLRGW